MADAIQADDQLFTDEEAVLEHYVAAFYSLSATTASAICQQFYGIISRKTSRAKLIEELIRTQVEDDLVKLTMKSGITAFYL